MTMLPNTTIEDLGEKVFGKEVFWRFLRRFSDGVHGLVGLSLYDMDDTLFEIALRGSYLS